MNNKNARFKNAGNRERCMKKEAPDHEEHSFRDFEKEVARELESAR